MATFGIKDRWHRIKMAWSFFAHSAGKTHEDILVEYSLSFSFLEAGPQSLVEWFFPLASMFINRPGNVLIRHKLTHKIKIYKKVDVLKKVKISTLPLFSQKP